MSTRHVIAQCAWNSTFDRKAGAHDLQNFISQWSNMVLKEELGLFFDDCCPSDQSWRIDSMNLDLGDILLEDLPEELPRRLRESLRSAFEGLFTQQQIRNVGMNDNKLRIHGRAESMQEFIAWYLQRGYAPWWHTAGGSALLAFDQIIEQQPQIAAAIIRELGHSEIVRKRLVRQCGEVRVRRIIRMLEPWQGDYICHFADNLFVVQAERRIPQTDSPGFREHTWLMILANLLVDRGTLFNKAAFVRSNLSAIARHYQIDYRQLLERMFIAVRELETAGLVTHDFLVAIKTIHAQDCSSISVAKPAISEPQDPWLALQKMLRYRLKRHAMGSDTVQVDELFSSLAQEDPARMAELLLKEGKAAAVIQGMLDNFNFDELAMVVKVVEPQDHQFVVSYVRRTQAGAELQHWDEKKVWQVVLVYLLADCSSHFNRRQLIHETLSNLCRIYNINYLLLLNLLIQSIQETYASPHRFDLLSILHDLRGGNVRKETESETRHRYLQAALSYLKTGSYDAASVLNAADNPRQLFLLLNSVYSEQSIAVLLRASSRNIWRDNGFSERLLSMIGPADLPLLLDLIEPDAAGFCVTLLGQLMQWHKQAALPSLDRMDLGFQLPALIVQSLAGRGKNRPFDLAAFWNAFTSLLGDRCGVDIQSFHRQLRLCLGQGGQSNGLSRYPVAAQILIMDLASPLHFLFEEQAAFACKPVPAADSKRGATVQDEFSAEQWSKSQLFSALRMRLSSPDPVHAEGVPLALSDLPLAELWREIECLGERAVSEWIDQQEDRQLLLTMLSRERHVEPVDRWLSAQVPEELKSPAETLSCLSSLFRQGGGWQGATAVLERHLGEVFWTSIFDPSAKKLSVSELLASMIASACLRLNVPLSECLSSLKDQSRLFPRKLWQAAYGTLLKQTTASSEMSEPDSPERHESVCAELNQDGLAGYLNHPDFVDIARHMLSTGSPPSWLNSSRKVDLPRLLFDVFSFRPSLLPALLDDLQHRPAVMFRLLSIAPFAWLVDAMQATMPDKQVGLSIARFQQWLERLPLPNINRQQRTAILFELVLSHWLKQEWDALSPDELIRNYLGRLVVQQRISREEMQRAFAPKMAKLPAALRQSLEKAMDGKQAPQDLQAVKRSTAPSRLKTAVNALMEPQILSSPVDISNCGLVLLQGFIPTFFSRLGLVENQKFITPDAQRRAVHYLQYLVTGCLETAEEHLILNKLLCGLDLHEPVEAGIEMAADEEETCQSLLHAVIGYWDEIEGSSIEGLRGNWLVRKGSLTDAKDHWHLVVEKRVYDLLLARAPFSYSVIKMPWMEKAVYVTWPT